MNQKKKKILVGIDGSEQSMAAVRYVASIKFSQKPAIVLFHVLRKNDQAFLDMGLSLTPRGRMAEFDEWEIASKNKAQKFMNEAFKILLDRGFRRESIVMKIHDSKIGVARDIISESLNGYDAVVIGRKGLSRLKALVFGSIANKLVEKITHVPVWVVEGTPQFEKILLSMDASEGAMKAVDYVGAILRGTSYKITLFHVIKEVNYLNCFREREDYVPSEQEIYLEDKWVEDERKEIESVFEKGKIRLVDKGIDPNNISTKFIKWVIGRSRGIVDEAKLGEYGSVVVGRRGLSRIEEFVMGGVSHKVLHLAKGMAVWVVS